MMKKRDDEPPVLRGVTGQVGDGEQKDLTIEILTGPKYMGENPCSSIKPQQLCSRNRLETQDLIVPRYKLRYKLLERGVMFQ